MVESPGVQVTSPELELVGAFSLELELFSELELVGTPSLEEDSTMLLELGALASDELLAGLLEPELSTLLSELLVW